MKEAHEKKHQRAFRCSIEACHYSVIGFSSAGELRRHRSKIHATPVEEREATTPQFINPDVEKDSSLAHSELNGESPMASSIWYRDESTMKDDYLKSGVFHDIMSTEEILELSANLQGGYDINDWQRRLGDGWVAFSDPASPIRVDIELDYTFQHTSVVCCVSFSKDGRYLATGCNNTCQIFDVVSGKVLCISESPNSTSGTDNYCRDLCFSPNGRSLVSCWEAKCIEIRSINDEGFCILTQELFGHERGIYGIDVSNDNSLIASCSEDMTVKIWAFTNGLCLNTFKANGGLTSVKMSPDFRLVAASCLDNCAYIWDVATGQLTASLKGASNSIYGLSFMERGTQIVAGDLDNAIMIWDIIRFYDAVNEPYNKSLFSTKWSMNNHKTLLGHSDFVLDVTATCDDRWILSGSKDESLRFWDPNTGKCSTILQGHKDGVIGVAADPTGRKFATASGDMKMRLWRYTEVDEAARRSDIHSLLT